MQLSHMRPVAAVRFDEPNLVSSAGLVPVMALAEKAGLADLAGRWLSVPTDKGANAGGKVTALVAGMVCGADCIKPNTTSPFPLEQANTLPTTGTEPVWIIATGR